MKGKCFPIKKQRQYAILCHIYDMFIQSLKTCGIELGVLTSNGIDDWFRTWFRNGEV